MRKVQMWMIESKMIQALGRARPIDNKCFIKIYSSYPPSDIDIKFIDNHNGKVQLLKKN